MTDSGSIGNVQHLSHSNRCAPRIVRSILSLAKKFTEVQLWKPNRRHLIKFNLITLNII